MKTKELVISALFVALTAISAFIKIQLPFVPLTFQLIVAIASGIFLGPKFGPLSQAVYLVLGLIGVPIFADGGGIAYVLRPTFGYLVSLPLASFVSGALWKKQVAVKSMGIFLGILSTYLIGVPYLWMIVNLVAKKPMSFENAIVAGFWPFIVKDIVLGVVLFMVALPVSKYLESKNTSSSKTTAR